MTSRPPLQKSGGASKQQVFEERNAYQIRFHHNCRSTVKRPTRGGPRTCRHTRTKGVGRDCNRRKKKRRQRHGKRQGRSQSAPEGAPADDHKRRVPFAGVLPFSSSTFGHCSHKLPHHLSQCFFSPPTSMAGDTRSAETKKSKRARWADHHLTRGGVPEVGRASGGSDVRGPGSSRVSRTEPPPPRVQSY